MSILTDRDIVDNLDSESNRKPLSARCGKALRKLYKDFSGEIESIRLEQKQKFYSFKLARPDGGGWGYFGKISGSSDSMNHVFTIYTGNGYNSRPDQNTTIHITVKDGNNGSNGAVNAFGITFYVDGYFDNRIDVSVRAIDAKSFKLFIYLPWENSHGSYSVFTDAKYEKPTAYNVDEDTSLALQNAENLTPDMRGYPVGSIYQTGESTDPALLFGGSWTQINGKFLFASGDGISAGTSGGSKTATLQKANLPSVTGRIALHQMGTGTPIQAVSGCFSNFADSLNKYRDGGTLASGSVSVGGIAFNNGGSSSPFSIMPPYMAVYMWKRTA